MSKQTSSQLQDGDQPARLASGELQALIETIWDRRDSLADDAAGSTAAIVEQAIAGLESGELRVAEPGGDGGWTVNEWLKKAVLLYFRTQGMQVIDAEPAPFWDKIPARFAGCDEAAFRSLGVRVVPGAVARRGSHIARDVVLMPSFVNIGA
ncbi:MAG: 2,3,4,5-tetrahydropyridine-2,6-dicarboxylate N-succinyltransferase, partial [Luteimonas sp.]